MLSLPIDPIFLTLLVLVAALISFIFEWLPVDITAITVTVVLMVLGLVTPEEGISGFGNNATITVMAMFILSAGISKTGVIQIIKRVLMSWGGESLERQIFTMGILVGPVSAFINNTAIVAIFLPLIEDWSKQKKISASKLMIPLSYATVMGGMMTLLGTSTNILASGTSQRLGFREFHLFEFTKLGIITFSLGLLYLTFVAPRILPSRKSLTGSFDEDYGLKDYISEVVVTPRSPLIGKTVRFSELQKKFDIGVLELIRGQTRFTQPLSDKVLDAGDILVVRGSRENLLQIREENGLDIVPDVKFQENGLESSLQSGEEEIAEVLLLSNSRLSGSTLRELRFRERYNATVLAIRRGEELVYERLGRIPLRFGDVLLVQGPRQSFLGLQTTREMLVIEQRDATTYRQNKAWITIAILICVVLSAALEIAPILVSAWVGVVLMIITGCLKPGEIYGAIRWDVIFLLAGLIPLGIAMEKSGATAWLADQLVAIGGDLSGYWILVFFYLVTALLTEILSNNATVVLMIPVAVEVAKALSLNPFAFMFAVTFAASNSYMTPIGYQTNTMVYGPGGYRFLDFTRVGAPLTCLYTFLTPLFILWLYGL